MTTVNPPAEVISLERDGYCLIKGGLPRGLIEALADDLDPQFHETARSQGAFSGTDTRRFGRLLVRSAHSAALVAHASILAIVETLLGRWCDHISLNLTQAIELMPGSHDQVPHRDQDMWPCSQMLAPGKSMELLVNVMWPLTPFTASNGATRLWPGSHRRQSELLIDPADAIVAELDLGDALLFLGSTLHAAGANLTTLPRRGVIISYCLGWLKPYELPWLAYPPDIARSFSPKLAGLAGYRVHRPNLGVFEGRCPSLLLSDAQAAPGAVDCLLPHQEDLIAAWRSGQVKAADFQTVQTP